MNSSLLKKILIIFFLLALSVNVNAQTLLKKIDLADMIVEYPEEILIERGWTKYFSISVSNVGNSDLYNVNVFIEGNFPEWFEFQNNESRIIQENESIEFVSKISIPYETKIGNYKFSLNINSDEINYKTDFTVRVFGAREDLLLYRIQLLKNNLNRLESEANAVEAGGINLTAAYDVFYEIRKSISLAEEQVNNQMFTQVTESIRDIEKLFIKARYEVSNPPKIETENVEEVNISSKDILIFSSGFGIILLLASLIYLIVKIKRENKIRLPNLRLKHLIIESKKLKELETEIEKVEESQEIIEEEYKEKLISKESYKELRLKYQEKLLELKRKQKKLRGY